MITSHFLRDIAEFLSAHGYAVFRYNKHYVSKYYQYGVARFSKLTLQDLLSDAKTVLATMRRNPLIDCNQLYLYGWSEGSAIAAQMALSEPDLKGVMLQGAVARSFSENLSTLFERNGLPYLRELAGGGKLGVSEISAALKGPGGVQAKMFTHIPARSYVITGGAEIGRNHG